VQRFHLRAQHERNTTVNEPKDFFKVGVLICLDQTTDSQAFQYGIVGTLDHIASLTVLPIGGGRLPLPLSVDGLTSKRFDGPGSGELWQGAPVT